MTSPTATVRETDAKRTTTPDLSEYRQCFPSLSDDRDAHAIFLDNPAGTQVPIDVIERVREYYLTSNAYVRGAF